MSTSKPAVKPPPSLGDGEKKESSSKIDVPAKSAEAHKPEAATDHASAGMTAAERAELKQANEAIKDLKDLVERLQKKITILTEDLDEEVGLSFVQCVEEH